MSRKRRTAQLFALGQPPQERIEIGGEEYCLLRVFKHDFWAATCLYEATGAAKFPKVIVKFGRTRPFCGLRLSWYAKLLSTHEGAIYHLLAGIEGVPRWVGSLGQTAFVIEYIDAKPLDQLSRPPEGFFDRLGEIFDQIHARGVAYCDANKRSNILVTADGRPFLVDYQIALRRRDDWPWPLRSIVRAIVSYLVAKDLYHLYKHKRHLAPEELRTAETVLSTRRGGIHWLHRKFTKPYRAIRRRFLRTQYAKGALESPTAELEDRPQPEKESWRKKG